MVKTKKEKTDFTPQSFCLTELVDTLAVKELLLSDISLLPVGGRCVEYLVKQLSSNRDIQYSTNEESPNGRRYANCASLQYLERTVRSYICKENSIDLDIRACFPTILLNISNEHSFPNTNLSNYLQIYDSKNYRLKENVRNSIHPIEPYDLGSDLKFNKHKWNDEFANEIHNIVTLIEIKYQKKIRLVLEEYEWTVIEKLMKYCKHHSIAIHGYCYDGLVVDKKCEYHLENINKKIDDLTIIIKEWECYKHSKQINYIEKFDWCDNSNFANNIITINNALYKDEDSAHRQILPLLLPCLRMTDSGITSIQKTESKNLKEKLTITREILYKIEKTQKMSMKFYIGREALPCQQKLSDWVNNYIGLLYIKNITPKPSTSPMEFSLFRGFGFTELEKNVTDDQIKEKIKDILDLIKNILCSGNEKLYEHFMIWLAHLIQFPFEVTEICYIFCGHGGIGKSTFKRLLGQVIGGWNFLPISGVDSIVAKFNKDLEGKCCVFMEEMKSGSKADFISSLNLIKNIIDAKEFLIEPKGIDKYKTINCLNFLGFSNNQFTLPTRDGMSRRVVSNWCDPSQRENETYFKKINKLLDDQYIVDCFGTYLKRLPNVSTNWLRFNRPITELKEMSDFKDMHPTEKILSVLYYMRGNSFVSLNDIVEHARKFNIQIDEKNLGYSIKTYLDKRNESNRKYHLRPTKSFDYTISRAKQCKEFMIDWNEMNPNQCRLDDLDELENDPELRIIQINKQIEDLQSELVELNTII